MQATTHDFRKYLDPSVLARIDGLELRARLIVEGFFAGIHHSPHRGLSVEFADHRAYSQGDNLRHVDWKLYGKTDKYFIKEYEQETNLDVMLVVDCSESMSYRSSGAPMSKHEYAISLAASLAYLASRQRDGVGLALFNRRITRFIRPSNSAFQWKTVIRELRSGTGPEATSIGRVLAELADRLHQSRRKTGLVVIISDLFDDPAATLRGLQQLRYRGQEVIVWNIWDPAELSLPFESPTLFEGLEAAGNVLVDPKSLRVRYREEVDSFQKILLKSCGQMHADYVIFTSAMAMDSVLGGYLASRSMRLRQARRTSG
jgi:uncharacterized protein (DUF58 family)